MTTTSQTYVTETFATTYDTMTNKFQTKQPTTSHHTTKSQSRATTNLNGEEPTAIVNNDIPESQTIQTEISKEFESGTTTSVETSSTSVRSPRPPLTEVLTQFFPENMVQFEKKIRKDMICVRILEMPKY